MTPARSPHDPLVELAGTSVSVPAGRTGFLPSDRQRTALAVAAAAIGFVVAWYLIHHGWYRLDRQWDTREYAKYARYIAVGGLVPYRDFSVEYPPLSLPIFLIPRLLAGNSFSGYMTVLS